MTIDMNKPYVGYQENLMRQYDLVIVQWEGSNFLSMRLGGQASKDRCEQSCQALEAILHVQNAGQVRVDFFPQSIWVDGREQGYTLPDGYEPRKV